MKNKNIDDPTVYAPTGAKINIENKDLDPPTPEYNKRAKVFDLESIKKVVGGEYGRTARESPK
jgi:hypothetical protein